MAATIHEGVLWEFTADASAVIEAYQKATRAGEQAGAAAQKAAQAGNVAFEKLGKQVETAGRQLATTAQHVNASGAGFRSASVSVEAFHAQLDRVQAFAWNNTSLSGNDIDRVINPIKGLSGAIGIIPTVAGAAALAVEAMAVVIGARAQEALAKLGDIQKQTGVDPNAVQGVKIVGARAGLGTDSAVAALQNASQQFEQFRRNSGEVKDAIEKIDESFLKVVDGARTAGDFIDIVGQKIRALPREEGIDLAKALFGDDAGQRLYEPIMRGQIAMSALREAAVAAGNALDAGVVARADEMQRKIDEAATIAGGKMLSAMQSLGDPVAQLKLEWYGFVDGIAEAIRKSAELQAFLTGMLHPIEAIKTAINSISASSAQIDGNIGRLVALKPGESSDGKSINDLKAPQTAGVPRARYEARDDSGGGASKAAAAKAPDDKSADIIKSLNDQLNLLQSVGAEHDRIALAQKIEAEQTRAGKDATQAEKDSIAQLVTQVDEATRAQRRQKEEVAATASAVNGLGQTFETALEGVIINGDKAEKVIKNLLASIARASLQGALLGQGPLAGVLGTQGQNGQAGGLLGLLAGGATGGGGLLGGLLSALPKFADGGNLGPGRIGLVGEAGPELIRGPASITPLAKVPTAAPKQQAAPQIIHFNVTAPNPAAFAQSEAQISALLVRALKRGSRNV